VGTGGGVWKRLGVLWGGEEEFCVPGVQKKGKAYRKNDPWNCVNPPKGEKTGRP